MKTVIIGPGALGSLFAASLATHANLLAEGEAGLWLLDHNRERADLLNSKGLILEENGEKTICSIPVTSDTSNLGAVDLALLCVKSNDVENGLAIISPLLGPDSLLIALQNGIGHLELLNSMKTPGVVAIGVTAQGANLAAPGHVRHAGVGVTRIGFAGQQSAEAVQILAQAAALLTGGGIETEVTDDIISIVWTKLLVNVGINALTAILDCPNGMLAEPGQAREQLTAAVREAAAVARVKGISIDGDPVANTIAISRATGSNISSMLQDVRSKRRTEINAINGAIVAEGRRLNIPVPVNEELVRKVKEIERGYNQ